MKRIDLKYRIILFIIGGGIVFSLLFFSFRYNWNISFILKDILYFPVNIVVPDNNQQVTFTGRELELQKEVEDLKKLLGIKDVLTDFESINATVITRNVSYWNEELTINKGSSDNIKEGMAVIDGNGLIGRITKVSFNTSIVKLITSNANDNKVSIKLWSGDNSINKILEQDENNNLIISGIDNNFDIKVNDLVTTSGLSDIYPSGITIGYIEKIENDKFGISKKAYIKHSGDLDNVRFVSVLIRGGK